MQIKEIKIDDQDAGQRLDAFLANFDESKTRSMYKKLIEEGYVSVNDSLSKPSYKINVGDIIEIKEKESRRFEKIAMNIKVLYEDDDIAVIDKPRGLIVHPTNDDELSLVNFLLYRFDSLSSIDESRPGIIHRLDKDTSGLIIIAKNNEAHEKMKELFKSREIYKEYITIAVGTFKDEVTIVDKGIMRDPIKKIKMCASDEGKSAHSEIHLIKQNENYAYLSVIIKTGRTHQIRVHLAYINHPVLGDKTYGYRGKIKMDGQVLHCRKVSFIHPITNNLITIESDLPEYFKEALIKTNLYKAKDLQWWFWSSHN